MNLLVDIGSTCVKAAFSEGSVLGKIFRYQGEKWVDFIIDLCRRDRPEVMVVAVYRPLSSTVAPRLRSCCSCLIVLDGNNERFFEHYNLPKGLSADRCASIIAARGMFPSRGCTIFDLGNTISTDFIDASGKWIGGRLTLGCVSRYKAMARYAKGMPNLQMGVEPEFSALTLEDSIRSGIEGGIVFEIDAQCARFAENITIITGADANYFVKRLKNSIFAVCNLVLIGLAQIADTYDEEFF